MPGFRSRAAAVFGLLAATVISAAPSGAHVSELICHTSNSSDCYPRVFVPTHEFQIVHDDQELPPGLHVRINIDTQKKEAKINVPGEQDASLNGLLVQDGAVVAAPLGNEHAALPIPKGAPTYDAVGKVKEPERESESFVAALTMLSSGALPEDHVVDESLDHLEELAHDIYYGLKLAETTDALRTLLCLMVVPSDPANAASSTPRDHRAASILAGALSNNAAALSKVADAWAALAASKCSSTKVPLGQALMTTLTPAKTVISLKESASLAKAKISVINGLVKNADIRLEFLNGGMMDRLLEMLALEGKEWAGAQRKAGELVLDNFLDEDMGAKLGQWPRVPRLSDVQCRTDDFATAEGCWDYHVEKIMRANKAAQGHWSTVLHEKLAAARAGQSVSVDGDDDARRHEL